MASASPYVADPFPSEGAGSLQGVGEDKGWISPGLFKQRTVLVICLKTYTKCRVKELLKGASNMK